MNKDFLLSNKAYDVETSILNQQKNLNQSSDNITVTNKEGVSQLGVEFPEGLELLGANYNKAAGTTVILCRDTNTGEILASCTGTNFNDVIPSEAGKDVRNWLDIFCYGISPYGEEVTSVIQFFNTMVIYPSRISGHSLGGNIAQLVGLRLNIDIEVYNSAPLYLDSTNLITKAAENQASYMV